MTNTPDQPLDATPRRRVVLMGAAATVAGAGALAACSSGSATSVAASDPGASVASSDPGSPSDAAPSSDPAGATSDPASPQAAGTTAKATPRTAKATPAKSTAKTTAKATTDKPASTTKPATKTPTPTKPAEDFSKGALAKLSSVPVGGSAVVGGVVIFRSSSNRVVGHSPICTHQGCKVNAGGRTLNCPCHGSAFDAATGAVKQGPAAAPLPGVGLVIKGDYIHQA